MSSKAILIKELDRTLIYTISPIESLNATIKTKTKPKGSFPTQQKENNRLIKKYLSIIITMAKRHPLLLFLSI